MNNKGKRVHNVAADHNIQFYQFGNLITCQLIIKRGVSFSAGFERIEKVIDNFVQRQVIVNFYTVGVQIFGILISSAAFLAQLHNGADIGSGAKMLALTNGSSADSMSDGSG